MRTVRNLNAAGPKRLGQVGGLAAGFFGGAKMRRRQFL
jgi:hypothetical protein